MPKTAKRAYLGRCVVMQPFDGGTFDRRYKDIFESAIVAADLEPYRVDRDPSVDVPIDEIEKAIAECLVCFAEITTDNPNVWYELGYASSQGKQTCMVCSSERKTAFPFDIRHRNIIKYEVASTSDFERLGTSITDRLKAILKKGEVQSLFTFKPTTESQGLSGHEIAVLALLMARFDAVGVSSWELKQDMQRAGYTDIAAGIAIEKLRRSDFLVQTERTDDRDEPYLLCTLTAKGTDWLIRNEDKLSLRKEGASQTDENDIPF